MIGSKTVDLFTKQEEARKAQVEKRKLIRSTCVKTPGPVKKLQRKQIFNSEEALKTIISAMKHRETAETNNNTHSSRTHAVFSFVLKNNNTETKITFIDVCGAEGASAYKGKAREVQFQSHIIQQDLAQVMYFLICTYHHT